MFLIGSAVGSEVQCGCHIPTACINGIGGSRHITFYPLTLFSSFQPSLMFTMLLKRNWVNLASSLTLCLEFLEEDYR